MTLDDYTMVLLSGFLSLVYGLQFLIIRAYSGRRGVGLVLWAASFFSYGSGNMVSLLFYRSGSPFLTESLTLLTTFAGLFLLQAGWCRYFQHCSGPSYRLFAVLVAMGSGILFFLSGDLDLGILNGLINILMLGWTVVYVMRFSFRAHESTLLSSALFTASGLLFSLMPLLWIALESHDALSAGIAERLFSFSYPLQDSCIMFALLLAAIHRDRLHDLERIKENEALASELESQTVTDPLTGISNRRGFERILRYEFEQLKRGGGYAVALGDIDHFKRVNDSWGHDCGDMVIKEVARLLGENIRAQAVWPVGGEKSLSSFSRVTTGRSSSRPLNG